MQQTMREVITTMRDTPRDVLDDSGIWPRDLLPKLAVAGTYMVTVCLTAHYTPFSLEAFLASLLAYGLVGLGWLIFAGVIAGVIGAIMCLMEAPADSPSDSQPIDESSVLQANSLASGEVKGEMDVPGTKA